MRPRRGLRLWGLTAQLYGVRSARNWGIGDFTDLADLAEQAAGLGAGAIGINPLHALFPADPNHISPYSPSSRLFLNVLYLDPEAVPDLAESSEAQALLGDAGFAASSTGARAAELVDYPAVWRLKLRVLELLFESFRARHLASLERRGPARSASSGRRWAEALERHALFDALHEHVLADHRGLVLAPLAGAAAPSGQPRGRRIRARASGARSTSSPTCNGSPTFSSARRRRAPGPRACRSVCIRTSRSR